MLAAYAGATMKVVPLLNGAAALGALNFVSNRPDVIDHWAMPWAIITFGVGAFLGGVIAGASYMSQMSLIEKPKGRSGGAWRSVAMVSAILGYLAFLVGVILGVIALAC